MNDAKRAQMIRVVELYYIQNMTQQEIASTVGISRPTVSRLLEDARNQDIIEIKLNIAEEIDIKLSNQIRKALELKEAIVVDTRETEEEISLEKTAKTAAEYLSGVIQENMVIGVSWGRTLKAVARAIEPVAAGNVKVVQTVGGLGEADSNFDGSDVAYTMAAKLNGTYQCIVGPAILPNEKMVAELQQIPAINQALEQAARADIYLMGIGSFSEATNSLQRAGYIKEAEKADLIARGCTAHIFARVLKSDGSEMTEFNKRVLSIPLECLKGKGRSIGITASAMKAEAVLAVTRGKYLDVLIIDKSCAEAIIEKMAGCNGE